jgi:hypothetical protein
VSRREELLKQLKAVEDAIAKKKKKMGWKDKRIEQELDIQLDKKESIRNIAQSWPLPQRIVIF